MKKKWYKCPYCKQRLMKYSEGASSKLVYFKCKRCKREVEIKIEDS